jgi:hypothetical protein
MKPLALFVKIIQRIVDENVAVSLVVFDKINSYILFNDVLM